jgi:hypothetical protein
MGSKQLYNPSSLSFNFAGADECHRMLPASEKCIIDLTKMLPGGSRLHFSWAPYKKPSYGIDSHAFVQDTRARDREVLWPGLNRREYAQPTKSPLGTMWTLRIYDLSNWALALCTGPGSPFRQSPTITSRIRGLDPIIIGRMDFTIAGQIRIFVFSPRVEKSNGQHVVPH